MINYKLLQKQPELKELYYLKQTHITVKLFNVDIYFMKTLHIIDAFIKLLVVNSQTFAEKHPT